MVHHARDARGANLGVIGDRAGEQSVHRLVEQLNPAIELTVTERRSAGEFEMNGERVTAKRRATEENCFPKVIHLRQVRIPIDARHVVEYGTDNVVTTHSLIKSIDEPLDVGAR